MGIAVSLLLGLAAFAAADATGSTRGEIATVDGKVYRGKLQFRSKGVAIETDDGEHVLPLEHIQRLQINRSDDASFPKEKPTKEPPGKLPKPWRYTEVGKLVTPGEAKWKDGTFFIDVAKRRETEEFDAFGFVYQPIEGDCEVVARVVSIDNADEDSRAGVIIRDGLDTNAHNVKLEIAAPGGAYARQWTSRGGSARDDEDPQIKLPYWVRLVRRGRSANAYTSPDGRYWQLVWADVKAPSEKAIYVGLAARVQNGDQPSTVVVDNVSVRTVGPDTELPRKPRVVLVDGSVLSADIDAADETAVELSDPWDELSVSTVHVARIEFFHPLPKHLERYAKTDRQGVALRNGDFLVGKFQKLADGTIRVNSPLFGVQEHKIKDRIDALFLHPVTEEPPAYRIETRDGQTLMADAVRLAEGGLELQLPTLGTQRLSVERFESLERIETRGRR